MTDVRILTAALVLSAATLTAQAHPDLSGHWVLDAKKTAAVADAHAAAGGPTTGGALARAGGGGSGGAMMTNAAPTLPEYQVTVTASTVTIDRLGLSSPQTAVYKLDGTESVNVIGPTTTRSKTRWEARTLVIEGARIIATSQGDVRSTFKDARSLDEGGAMVVEQTRQVEGQAPSVTYQVFVRVPKG